MGGKRACYSRRVTHVTGNVYTGRDFTLDSGCTLPAVTIGLDCKQCGRKTVHERSEKVNHILHFLLTFFTCGLWGIVWAILGIDSARSPYQCSQCGSLANQS